MSELRLHLDEDAEAHALVHALRDRGVDLTTSSEAGLIEISDEVQPSIIFRDDLPHHKS